MSMLNYNVKYRIQNGEAISFARGTVSFQGISEEKKQEMLNITHFELHLHREVQRLLIMDLQTQGFYVKSMDWENKTLICSKENLVFDHSIRIQEIMLDWNSVTLYQSPSIESAI